VSVIRLHLKFWLSFTSVPGDMVRQHRRTPSNGHDPWHLSSFYWWWFNV